MQITRFLSLNEPQFLGCLSAFVEALNGELNGALGYLRRLEGKRKGSAFAYEMHMDRHRYGAMIVLERWADFIRAFAGHVALSERQPLFDNALAQVEGAQKILERVNHVIDEAPDYGLAAIEACLLAYGAVEMTFQEERRVVAQTESLGPLLPEEFKEYRRVFLGDLAER